MTKAWATTYSPAIKTAHWLTATLIAFAYVLAFSIRSAQSAEQVAWSLMLHRSTCVVTGVLTLVRIGVRALRCQRGRPIYHVGSR